MKVEWAPISELLKLQREPIDIDLDRRYRKLGVYSWGRGMIHHPPIPGAEMGSLRYFRIPSDALVVSNIQAWEQAVAISTANEASNYVASNRFLPYVPAADELDVRFARHFLLSSVGHELLKRASPGTQVRNRTLGRGLFESSLIPVPTLEKQQLIAAYLDRIETSTAGTGGPGTLDGVDAIRGSWFSFPEGRWALFGDLMELHRRDAVPGDKVHEVGVRSFGRGLFRKPPTSAETLGGKRIFSVRRGDLVISNIFAWEGAVAMAGDAHDGLVGSHRFMTWTAKADAVHSAFVCQYLLSPDGLQQLRNSSPGSAGRNRTLSIANLRRVRVPVPSMSVQSSIVAIAGRCEEARRLVLERDRLAKGVLPAARNQVFNAMR